MADDSPTWAGPDYDVPDGKVLRAVARRRHWKQQYDASAAFVWRKPTRTTNPDGELITFPRGSIVPTWFRVQIGPTKLRRMWESRFIELYDFGRNLTVNDEYLPVDLPLRGQSATPPPAPKRSKREPGKRKAKGKAKKAAKPTPAPEPVPAPLSAVPDIEEL